MVALRVSLYEDADGLNVAMVNPTAVNQFAEIKDKTFSAKALYKTVDALQSHVRGEKVFENVGPVWKDGETTGIGGGELADHVREIFTAKRKSDTLFRVLSSDVEAAIRDNRKDWKLVYKINMADTGMVLFGITKNRVEKKAFAITGADRISGDNICPGIDHSLAFPIEVVVNRFGDRMQVETIDEGFRMKLYFGDTSEWAFLKHFYMPPQNEKEIASVAYPCYPSFSTACSRF